MTRRPPRSTLFPTTPLSRSISPTGPDTGGWAPPPLTTTVSTPAYRTVPSLERMPWSVTSNGCALPMTTTGTVSVASPAASTGTVVSTTAPGSRVGTPTLEMDTTTT